MNPKLLWTLPVVFAVSAAAAYSDYLSAKAKLDRIENEQLRAGSRVELSLRELNAYVAQQVPTVTDGVRDTKLQVLGPGVARGEALVDFAKVRRSQGHPPGWLMSKLLEGARPVSVTARITSAAGRATVDVQRVEISGIEIDGRTLDFLIQNCLLPLYPDARIGRPFDLAHRVERFDVQPSGVSVLIAK